MKQTRLQVRVRDADLEGRHERAEAAGRHTLGGQQQVLYAPHCTHHQLYTQTHTTYTHTHGTIRSFFKQTNLTAEVNITALQLGVSLLTNLPLLFANIRHFSN